MSNDYVIPGTYKRLFGERTGIIKQISYIPPDRKEPPVYVSSAEPTNISILQQKGGEEMALTSVSGKGLSVEKSLLTCIGEAAERYCLYFPGPESRLTTASYRDLEVEEDVMEFKYIKPYDIDHSSKRPDELTKSWELEWVEGSPASSAS